MFIDKYNKSKNIYKAIINHHKVAQVIINSLFGKLNKFKIVYIKANYLLSMLMIKRNQQKR
jgi:hypothetical protein